MKILVRLPNWLGDMVMAVGVLDQLPSFFADAQVSVIAKKGIHELLPFFPPLQHRFVFDKEAFEGIKGLWRFGRSIRQTEKFDLFISLPNSFSSALMGYATDANERIGYKNEGRNLLLTKAYSKTKSIHRAEEYVRLLALFTNKSADRFAVRMHHAFTRDDYIVINTNSEA